MRKKTIPVTLLKGLFLMYFLTAVFLLGLTFLLYRCSISAGMVTGGIIVTYVCSGFFGGFYLGKKLKMRKFLWGFAAGILYFLGLFLLSVLIHQGIDANVRQMVLTLIICSISGMAGGMVG